MWSEFPLLRNLTVNFDLLVLVGFYCRHYEFVSGIYKGDYLSRNLNYLSNIDEIVAHPRGFEPLAS